MSITENSKINLSMFYPQDKIIINSIDTDAEKIIIHMNSITKTGKCICCGNESQVCHGTYHRKIQDISMLNKIVYLDVNAREYKCTNPECDTVSFAEDIDGFLSHYGRMTERCANLICMLALETSCEGCARICKDMNIKISGDTVIRLLIKRFENQPKPPCSDTVGVDDFAFKKRNSYGTIVVDEKSRKTLAVLDGRDGKALKEWLKNNKHIKTVTRDRASAYSSAIREILPDAMQVADRFHLHQNLLGAIKSVVNSTLPVEIKISEDNDTEDIEQLPEQDENGKKNTFKRG